tara:strand:- start:2682 stop:2846 length:165 start_codon:yes stop_codon:yes gene_type:complete
MALLKEKRINTDTLTKQELNYLLTALADTTFSGRDVLLLSAIVEKLQNQLEAKK